jgi:hypothetical protein
MGRNVLTSGGEAGACGTPRSGVPPRRGGDSNPRRRDYRRNGFRDRRIQPLCHLSAAECIHCAPPLQPRLAPRDHVPQHYTLTLGLLRRCRLCRSRRRFPSVWPLSGTKGLHISLFSKVSGLDPCDDCSSNTHCELQE